MEKKGLLWPVLVLHNQTVLSRISKCCGVDPGYKSTISITHSIIDPAHKNDETTMLPIVLSASILTTDICSGPSRLNNYASRKLYRHVLQFA